MRCRCLVLAVVSAALVAGCGSGSGSARHTPRSVLAQQTPARAGHRTFQAPGIAIHFSYPRGFSPAQLSSVDTVVGSSADATVAAIGLSQADLIIVEADPLGFAVTSTSLPHHQRQLDALVSRAAGRTMTSTIGRVAGHPALAYAPVAVQGGGLPTGTTDEIHAVFVGRTEYELQCQSTPAHRAKLTAGCRQMLRTFTG